jgi:threonine/homoserine/homoserine lactone efflux protein
VSFIRFSTGSGTVILAIPFSLQLSLMNLILLSTYMLTILTLLVTPGPVVALVTGTAARHGMRRAFATVIGAHGASLVLIGLATLMLVGLVSIDALSLRIAALAGCGYIGFSAWRGLRSSASPSGEQKVMPGGVRQGFLVGVANPKDILFFAALFPQFISITPHVGSSLLVLALVWMLFDFSVMTCYILVVRRWVAGKQQRRLEVLSHCFLLLIALAGVGYNLWEIL